MGVDYTPVGGIGVKTSLKYTDENTEMLDDILRDTPFCYNAYGSAYSNTEKIVIRMDDPPFDNILPLVGQLQELVDEHGIGGTVKWINELHVW